MPSLKELAEAAKSWATQEASDIASGAKKVPARDTSWVTPAAVKEQPSTFPGRMLRKAQSIGITNRDPGREAARLTRSGMGPTKTKFDAPSKPYIKEHAMPDEAHDQMTGLKPKPGGLFAPNTTTMNDIAGNQAKDLGEQEAGSTLKQAARARGIAKAQLNQSSSVGSHEGPHETDLHAGGNPWTPSKAGTQITDTGEGAGAFGAATSQPKHLGRITAKV